MDSVAVFVCLCLFVCCFFFLGGGGWSVVRNKGVGLGRVCQFLHIRHTAPINYMCEGNLNKYCQAGTDLAISEVPMDSVSIFVCLCLYICCCCFVFLGGGV